MSFSFLPRLIKGNRKFPLPTRGETPPVQCTGVEMIQCLVGRHDVQVASDSCRSLIVTGTTWRLFVVVGDLV